MLRLDALHALDHKRGHIDGAALFWTLPTRRDAGLRRLLVTYELIQDYLDGASERGAAVGAGTGPRLYRALGDALDPDRPISDYYRGHPWSDDAGYLRALVESCRAACHALPSFDVVRPMLAKEVAHATVLDLNHVPDPVQRDVALETWAAEEFPGERGLRWYELTAAASGWITTHALLALAAEPRVTEHDVHATHSAYFPWFALTLTMLDSYVDAAEDAANDDHNYMTHFPNDHEAVATLCTSIDRSARGVLALPHGERHAVLLSCMIALYLSKDSARAPALKPTTRRIARAGGSLPKLLLPVLRIWRVCNSQSSAT